MMRYLLLILMMVFLGTYQAQSQGAEPPSDLTEMLTNLKQSADVLGVSNAQLKDANQQLRDEIARLRLKLGQLKEQEDQLLAQKIKLQDKNEQKARKIALLQQNLYAINSEIEQITINQKQGVEQIAKLKQEEANVAEQINQISNLSQIEFQDPIESEKDVAKRKEKINLLKMLDQSHLRQEQLNVQLLQLRPTGASDEVAQLTAEREILLERIKSLKQELDTTDSDVAGSLFASNDVQALTKEMSVLESNYQQLKDLWVKMQEKAQLLVMTTSQKEEKSKLATNLNDLNRESSALRGQLHGLREQMVDLDKRKTYLQQVLSQQ